LTFALDVVDCQAHEGDHGSLTEMRVADFFSEYMMGAQRTGGVVKKLKDWPAYTEFREKFPDLYDDFHQAMPVPDYTRRDGVLNISAHVSRLEVGQLTMTDSARRSSLTFVACQTSGPRCTTLS
jgi:hypothetical protein